jgi:hypothetical protein
MYVLLQSKELENAVEVSVCIVGVGCCEDEAVIISVVEGCECWTFPSPGKGIYPKCALWTMKV